MTDFIARQNSERLRQRLASGIRLREPAAFSRLAASIVEIAVVTGVVARLYRAVVLTHAGDSALSLAVSFLVGAGFVLLMATLHLSRFPLRTWSWRAPAFAAIESAVEAIVSLCLIAAHREPLGTGAATFRDWPVIAGTIMLRHVIVICVFALLLAVTVRLVRYQLLKREHRAWSSGTVRAGLPGEALLNRRRGDG